MQTKPSAATLSILLFAFAMPFFLNNSTDFSISPFVSSIALLQSLNPTPVISLNCFTFSNKSFDDIKSFYLETPLDRYEYMRMPFDIIPAEFADAYNLHEKVKDGYVYMEIQKGMYGLPAAGMLANRLLKERLKKDGYFELPHTPGLWKNDWRPITFSLVVDDFGIKYVGEQHFDHLIAAIKRDYTVEVDETGGLYCGISLDWNYAEGYVDISMPGYVLKQLTRYDHTQKRKAFTPYDPAPSDTARHRKLFPPPTTALPSTKKANGEYSKSLAVFCIMTAPSTLPF